MPQGGSLLPLLSNILLDELDKELERRGHSFCRYADDCNIHVSNRKAGDNLLKDIRAFVENKLKLKVNEKFYRNGRLVIGNITSRSCGLLIFVQVVAVFSVRGQVIF